MYQINAQDVWSSLPVSFKIVSVVTLAKRVSLWIESSNEMINETVSQSYPL